MRFGELGLHVETAGAGKPRVLHPQCQATLFSGSPARMRSILPSGRPAEQRRNRLTQRIVAVVTTNTTGSSASADDISVRSSARERVATRDGMRTSTGAGPQED